MHHLPRLNHERIKNNSQKQLNQTNIQMQSITKALQGINDFHNKEQIKNALSSLKSAKDRLVLIEKIAQNRENQTKAMEMERIERLRPLLERVKRRFLKILRIAHAHKKTYGENSDFGKFGMRGSQIRPKKKKATFLNLIQLSTMIAKDEVIEFNDIIDKEYCSHRKDIQSKRSIHNYQQDTSNESSMKTIRTQLERRTVIQSNLSQFQRKEKRSDSIKAIQQTLQLIDNRRINMRAPKQIITKLLYLTNDYDSSQAQVWNRTNSPVSKRQSQTDSPYKKDFKLKTNILSKVHQQIINIKEKNSKSTFELPRIQQRNKKDITPSAIYQYFNKFPKLPYDIDKYMF